MKVAGIKVNSPEEARRVRWLLGVHAGAAACGAVSLAWLIALIVLTSHEGECGGYEVQHDENLGLWHTSNSDSFSIGYVCERPADLGCLADWSEFQSSCYIMVCESVSYKRAEEGCVMRGAQLVSINSQLENDHVLSLCGRQSCWIGLSRAAGAKLWHWADGSLAGWFGNWSTFTKFGADAVQSMDRTCLNKGPPDRFIEEPVFIIKAVGKFVVPSCLMFVAYLALKRRSTDLAQCLCIVDGFFAACLFAEMVIMIFRFMKGGPWIDVIAYVLFMAFASCGVAFCCACSARTFKAVQEQMVETAKDGKEGETESIMRGDAAAGDVEEGETAKPVKSPKVHASQAYQSTVPSPVAPQEHPASRPDASPPMQRAISPVHTHETSVPPQALGNTNTDLSGFDYFEVEPDAAPAEMPTSFSVEREASTCHL